MTRAWFLSRDLSILLGVTCVGIMWGLHNANQADAFLYGICAIVASTFAVFSGSKTNVAEPHLEE